MALLPSSPILQNSPQAFGEQSFPQNFLDDVKMRIVNCTEGLTKDRVFFSKHSTNDLIKWAPDADRFVALSLPTMTPNKKYSDGGGQYNTQFDGVLLARIFVRNESDIENRDFNLMTDQIFGELAFVQKIVTALQEWNGPIDPETEESLFNRPMSVIGQITSEDRVGERVRWGVSEARFELPFVADLQYPYPANPVSPPVPPPPPPPPPPMLFPGIFFPRSW